MNFGRPTISLADPVAEDDVAAVSFDVSGTDAVTLDQSSSSFAIARYNDDGSLDGGFGSSGVTLVDFDGGDDWANVCVRQSSGKLIVVGVSNSTSTRVALTRLDASGQLDVGFGVDGRVVTTWGDNSVAMAAAITGGGDRLLVAGAVDGDFLTAQFVLSDLCGQTWYQQDVNHNVTSIADSGGTVLERFIYTPYGVRTVLDASFTPMAGQSTASRQISARLPPQRTHRQEPEAHHHHGRAEQNRCTEQGTQNPAPLLPDRNSQRLGRQHPFIDLERDVCFHGLRGHASVNRFAECDGCPARGARACQRGRGAGRLFQAPVARCDVFEQRLGFLIAVGDRFEGTRLGNGAHHFLFVLFLIQQDKVGDGAG